MARDDGCSAALMIRTRRRIGAGSSENPYSGGGVGLL
jgi:hypothetical protein